MNTLARIDRYAAARRPKNISLKELEALLLGQARMAKARGGPPRPEEFIKHALWLQEELPIRNAQILVNFNRLPFIALRSQSLAHVWECYIEDFEVLSTVPTIDSGKKVLHFVEEIKKSQQRRAFIVAKTREAIGDLRQFPDVRENLEAFLDKLFLTRIGRLLLEDHFVASVDHAVTATDLSSKPEGDGLVTETRIGPIVKSVAEAIQDLATEIYGRRIEINVVDPQEAAVRTIPRYVYFIFQEVLKNAVKATMERHVKQDNLPTVQVAIVSGSYDVQVKISDRGGGMPRKVLDNMWRYGYSGFTTTHRSGGSEGLMGERAPTELQLALSGYGVGMPLSRLYSRYLGGDIQVSQVRGHGTEVSIFLSRDGDSEEQFGEDDEVGDVDSFRGGSQSSLAPPS